jgi:hypothetical protein
MRGGSVVEFLHESELRLTRAGEKELHFVRVGEKAGKREVTAGRRVNSASHLRKVWMSGVFRPLLETTFSHER